MHHRIDFFVRIRIDIIPHENDLVFCTGQRHIEKADVLIDIRILFLPDFLGYGSQSVGRFLEGLAINKHPFRMELFKTELKSQIL